MVMGAFNSALYRLVHAQLRVQMVLEADLSTGSVASGDTSAAISQVNVQIQYNNMTIHARKTSCSYNALCTLVEEEWPF